jgi:hypothetical protein
LDSKFFFGGFVEYQWLAREKEPKKFTAPDGGLGANLTPARNLKNTALSGYQKGNVALTEGQSPHNTPWPCTRRARKKEPVA